MGGTRYDDRQVMRFNSGYTEITEEKLRDAECASSDAHLRMRTPHSIRFLLGGKGLHDEQQSVVDLDGGGGMDDHVADAARAAQHQGKVF